MALFLRGEGESSNLTLVRQVVSGFEKAVLGMNPPSRIWATAEPKTIWIHRYLIGTIATVQEKLLWCPFAGGVGIREGSSWYEARWPPPLRPPARARCVSYQDNRGQNIAWAQAEKRLFLDFFEKKSRPKKGFPPRSSSVCIIPLSSEEGTFGFCLDFFPRVMAILWP